METPTQIALVLAPQAGDQTAFDTDELRWDQGGKRQQELLKGQFQGVCPVVKVDRLWTHYIH